MSTHIETKEEADWFKTKPEEAVAYCNLYLDHLSEQTQKFTALRDFLQDRQDIPNEIRSVIADLVRISRFQKP